MLECKALNILFFVRTNQHYQDHYEKTPYEAWHGQKTQVHQLKEFGCHIPIQEKEKFDEKVNLCWLDQRIKRIQIHVLNTFMPNY